MELYTLDSTFLRQDIVDDYNSAIWTERYGTAGDVTLVVPLSKANIKKYPEGIFLSTPASNEVMILESIYKDYDACTLKCTGPTLTKFLNNRFLRSSDYGNDRNWHLPKDLYLNVFEAMEKLVAETCIVGGAYTRSNYFAIPNLSLGDISAFSDAHQSAWTLQWGPIYDTLAAIAQQYSVGFKLYLEHADQNGYSLKFLPYAGSYKSEVQFSSELDNFSHIKELHSIENLKHLVIAYSPGEVHAAPESAIYGYLPQGRFGFDLRVEELICDDLQDFSGYFGDLASILYDRAQKEIATHHPSIVVDGEITPNSMFQIGRDYGLGDIVKLKAMDGDAMDSRVTEYILSSDNTGVRNYPTLAPLTDTAQPPMSS